MTNITLDQAELGRRALTNWKKRHGRYEALARAFTRNPNVRVLPTSGTPCTDGADKIWLHVPLALGLELDHDLRRCHVRDEDGILICRACFLDEDLDITMYHEIAHQTECSFQDLDLEDLTATAARAVRLLSDQQAAGTRAAKLRDIIDTKGRSAGNYVMLAKLVSPHMPLLLNAMEDTRVNRKMMTERPGLVLPFNSSLQGILREGVQQPDGTKALWKTYPANLQAVMALMCKAHGYEYAKWLDPDVVAAVQDSKLDELVDLLNDTDTMRQVFALAFPMLERLRELGFFRTDDDVEDDAPEPEPEPQPEPDKGDDTDEDQDSSDSQESSDDGDAPPSQGSGDSDDERDDQSANSTSDDAGNGEQDRDGGDTEDTGSSDPESSDGPSDPGDDAADSGDDAGADDEGAEAAPEGPGDGSPGDEVDPSADGDAESDDGSGSDGGDSPDAGGEPGAGPGEPSMDGSPDGQPDGAGEPAPGQQPGGDQGGDPDDADGMASDGQADPDEGPGEDAPGSPGDATALEGKPFKGGHLEMGEPGTIEQDFNTFAGHNQDGTASAAPVPELDELVDPADQKVVVELAIIQQDFDAPSLAVGGFRKFEYGKYDSEARGWEAYVNDYMPPIEIPERVLMPAVQKLRIIFTDNKRHKVERNLKRGRRIDGKVLARRVPFDDPRVFHKRSIPGKKDWFVLVVIDMSSSTEYHGGHVRQGIKAAAFAKATVLDRLGIPFALYAHTAGGSKRSVQMYEIKAPDAPWSKDAQEALRMIGGSGYNLDGHAMEQCRKILMGRKERERLLMYYTDGEMPASNYDEELEILQKEIKFMTKQGIHVVGVGWETDSPNEHGLDTVEVRGPQDLKLVVKKLEDVLSGH